MKVEVEDGIPYYLCDKCDGLGYYWTTSYVDKRAGTQYGHEEYCEKCDGEGRLNWIESIFGKRSNAKRTKPGVYVHDLDVFGNPIGPRRKL